KNGIAGIGQASFANAEDRARQIGEPNFMQTITAIKIEDKIRLVRTGAKAFKSCPRADEPLKPVVVD
ncbi:MAG: hypothetical protein ABJ237_06870, partial [Parasphingorhabdus sp.]|uniref:hypothetical protein n=1 Tax=Parasphingorhabdus sp. TaxID=2709688 RepID=UPI00329A620C